MRTAVRTTRCAGRLHRGAIQPHGQLQLLASLPHPLLTLAPAIATAVRAGLRADFASIGVCAGEDLTPTAFWTERLSEPLLQWLGAHAEALLSVIPLALQRATDGQAVRDGFDAPGWTAHPVYQALFAQARWGMGVPLLDHAIAAWASSTCSVAKPPAASATPNRRACAPHAIACADSARRPPPSRRR